MFSFIGEHRLVRFKMHIIRLFLDARYLRTYIRKPLFNDQFNFEIFPHRRIRYIGMPLVFKLTWLVVFVFLLATPRNLSRYSVGIVKFFRDKRLALILLPLTKVTIEIPIIVKLQVPL